MAPPRTDKFVLLDERLPGGLTAFVAQRRSEGLSWERIGQEIHSTTGRRVSHASLRRWFADEPNGDTEAA